jgi:hypothetical protein
MSLHKYFYVKEKLSQAVYSLAVLPGDVRNRLRLAFLTFHTLRQDDFPLALQKDWLWIKKQLTRFGPVYDYKGDVAVGSVDNTMRIIRNSTGVKIAKRIYNLNMEIENYINEIPSSKRF